ncbi:MAG TPA: oligosaccharide flippase family protein [Gemmatimonadales bacterium]|jgi:O-antigen/teichoic acid export membrane protein|nr:oligosaccharide flippase family protein [Gemmatimonadales bacterium]
MKRPSITRGALLLTLGQILARVGDLLIAVLLVRILRPEEWATVALVLSVYTAAIGFGGIGLPEGMLFFLGRLPKAQHRRFVAQTMLLLSATGALAAAIILAVGPLLRGSPFDLPSLLPWLALAVLLEVPTLGAPQLLLAEERVSGSAAWNAAAALLRFACVTGPILLGQGVAGALHGLVGYAAIRLVGFLVLVARLTPRGALRPAWASIREQATYTAPLGLSILAASLNASVGKWIVAGWDAAHLGAFAVAATQVPIVPMLAASTGAVLATRMVHSFHHGLLDQARAYWLAAAARMTLVVAGITLAFVLGAPELIRLLFGGKYPDAVLPFQLCTLVLLHRIADHGGTLRAAGDTTTLWRASFLVLAANALLGIAATRLAGMLGMAAATLAASLLAWIYLLSRIARVIGTTLSSVIPWGLYARALLLASAAAVAAAWVSVWTPESAVLRLALKWTLFGGLYLAGIRGFGLSRALPAIPDDHAGFRSEKVPA